MDLRRRLMANNVGSALSTLLTSGQTFYAPFADKGSGEVSLVASGAGASQSPTFTRATTATTVNSAGLIVSVASGTPRSYYDPTTLAYRGYLAEGARTNLCLQSQDFATTWAATNVTVVANAVAAPDGTTTADSLSDGALNAVHFVNQSGLTLSATSNTYSCFLKAGTSTWVQLALDDGATTFYANFNLVTGVVGNKNASTTSTITAYPNGWYRCTMTQTTAATVAGIAYVVCMSADTATPGPGFQGTSRITYAWGAQLEAGAFASSYIPTTTASVTRNADVLTYPFSGNALTATGSAYAEILFNGTIAASSTALGFTSAGRAISRSLATEIQLFDGTTNLLGSGYQSVVAAARKQASSWGGSTMTVTADGAAVTSGAFDGAMGATTAIYIGTSDGALNPWFGTIRNVRIYQTQLSAAQLQAVTA